ncbi:MAG: porin, partial [Phycisphaerales bacterium]|nr:porin [Phycisphaerales bacterium]
MSHLYLLGVATLTLTSASFAGSDTNADLQARLEAAETRISELSAVTNANWLNDTRADEIRGLVHDVLADADTRASLQGSGATAGYNGGFTVGSADGNWSLKINGLLQTRWTSTDNDSVIAPAVNTGGQWAFNNQRSWLHLSGTIAGDYSYNIRHNLGTVGAIPGNDADWANGSMNLNDDWSLTMGTMKAATSREAMIGDQNQLAMDRQVVTVGGIPVAGYQVGQGAQLAYAGDDLRFMG